MSINWAFSIIFLPKTKKSSNVECGIYRIVSKLRMEIRLGSKCHRQMSSLISKMSLLSRWGNTRMQPESSCGLSDWHIPDAHIYQHFRKRSHQHQSLFVTLYLTVLERALYPPTLLILKSRCWRHQVHGHPLNGPDQWQLHQCGQKHVTTPLQPTLRRGNGYTWGQTWEDASEWKREIRLTDVQDCLTGRQVGVKFKRVPNPGQGILIGTIALGF